MPFSSILDRIVLKGLTDQGNEIVKRAKDNASWSRSIPNAISLEKAEKTSDGYSIEIVIDASEDGPAPHAAAFEYGSGEHGEKGEKYTISGMPWLVIPRERWPKYSPPPDVDPVVLSSVEHPGVKARPYLQPAIEESKPTFVARAAAWFKQAYLEDTVKVTVISAKK